MWISCLTAKRLHPRIAVNFKREIVSMAWAKAKFSKGEISKAGRVLIDGRASFDDRAYALDVMSNWRAAQAYPMRAVLMIDRKSVV